MSGKNTQANVGSQEKLESLSPESRQETVKTRRCCQDLPSYFQMIKGIHSHLALETNFLSTELNIHEA